MCRSEDIESQSIMVKFKMQPEMDVVSCFTQMEESIKGIGSKILNTAKDMKSLIMEQPIPAPIPKENPKVMEHMHGITDRPMKENGWMARSTGLESGGVPLGTPISANGVKGRQMDMECTLGSMETAMKGSSKTV